MNWMTIVCESRITPKCLTSATGRKELPSSSMGQAVDGMGFAGRRSISFGHVVFEMLHQH